MFKIAPETKAQGNGVALGALFIMFIGHFLGLPIFAFAIFLVVAMGVLGLVFASIDASRANAGQPAVTLRALFVRGVLEAFGGLALTLAFMLIANIA